MRATTTDGGRSRSSGLGRNCCVWLCSRAKSIRTAFICSAYRRADTDRSVWLHTMPTIWLLPDLWLAANRCAMLLLRTAPTSVSLSSLASTTGCSSATNSPLIPKWRLTVCKLCIPTSSSTASNWCPTAPIRLTIAPQHHGSASSHATLTPST